MVIYAMKNDFFAFLLSKFNWGIGYFIRPSPEVDYVYGKNGLEATFENKMCNRKPQMPSSVSNIF